MHDEILERIEADRRETSDRSRRYIYAIRCTCASRHVSHTCIARRAPSLSIKSSRAWSRNRLIFSELWVHRHRYAASCFSLVDRILPLSRCREYIRSMPEIGQTISDGWFQRARTRNVCARVTPFDLFFAHARRSAYIFYRLVSYPFNFSEWKVSRVFSITLKKNGWN